MTAQFRDPGIADGEKSVYTIRVGDTSAGTQFASLIEHDGNKYVSATSASSGDDFAFLVEQTILRDKGILKAESYRAESKVDGKTVSREEGYFADTKHIQFGGKLEAFPRSVMPLVGGLTLLRGLDFYRGAQHNVDLWIAFSICWPLEVKVEKRQRVDVPAGSFDAWQIRIRPSFTHINTLLDKVVAGFLPPYVAHMEAGNSHPLLRFSFPSGPLPWNPRGVLELAVA